MRSKVCHMETLLLQRLRALLGQTLEYAGHTCQIIEILDQENALVLRCEDSERVIQGNQFGDATRRVKRHHTVQLFDEHHALNPVIQSWLASGIPNAP
jgi:hypothetical protein